MTAPSARPWLYGLLDPCLLALLAERPDYGYGLAARLADAGFPDVPGGTIYPALLRLERRGELTAEWQDSPAGPRRKCYSLTPAGEAALASLTVEWLALRDGLDALLARTPRLATATATPSATAAVAPATSMSRDRAPDPGAGREPAGGDR